MNFVPRQLAQDSKVSFTVTNEDVTFVNYDCWNWPVNLHHVPGTQSDDVFYETFWSDSTLTFIIQASIARIRSLISRAHHNPDSQWEHGDITVTFTDDKPEDFGHPSYMQRCRVEVHVKEVKNA